MGGRLTIPHAKFYAASVVCAFTYLAFLNIVYRDLKPENLMLTTQGQVKVIDLGFAKLLDEGERTFTFCGTPDYMAPQIVCHTGYDLAADWWALGVLIYEMIAGFAPFVQTSEEEHTYKRIVDHMRGKVLG